MTKFIKCKEGNKFILTLSGAEIPRIRTKFNPEYNNMKQYKYTVPKSWIDNGYVTEVEDKDD